MTYSINVWHTPPNVKLTLSRYEAISAALQVLARELAPDDAQIDSEGNLFVYDEHHGGTHSWDEKRVLRKATKLDASVLEVRAALHCRRAVG